MAKLTIDIGGVLGEVSPLLYGHFTEHLVNVVYDGLWSEKLFGRKFEAPMTHRVRHEIAGPWEPWRPDPSQAAYLRAQVPGPRHAAAHADAHHSQAVSFLAGHDGSERGLLQTEVVVTAGARYLFRARARRRGAAVPLRVALRSSPDPGAAVLAEAQLALPEIGATRFGPAAAEHPELIWLDDMSYTEATAELVASASAAEGVLTITMQPPAGDEATLWLSSVSLMPADSKSGWHAGVVDALAALPVRLLKWPGGCMADDYDWRLGIGPRDGRHCDVDRAWAAWDENDVGTDDFLELCRLTGAEPVIGVNAGSGTAEMAAAWVEYANGHETSQWGARRASNGKPAPYGVRYWSVGNEMWSPIERGYAGAEGYAKRCVEMAAAMHEVDPGIAVIGVGQAGAFDRAVLGIAGRSIDQLQIHHYAPAVRGRSSADATAKVLTGRSFEALLRRVREDIASVPGCAHVRVALDEWGWTGGTHAGALFDAAALNAMHRMAPLVALAARSCVMNADGVITRSDDTVQRTPSYSVFEMFNAGHLPQAAEVSYDTARAIDASALADPATGAQSVLVLNAGEEAAEAELSPRAGAPGDWRARALVPGPGGPWGTSSAEVEVDVGPAATIVLPPFSLTLATSGH